MTTRSKQDDRLTRIRRFKAPATGTFYRVCPADLFGIGIDVRTQGKWIRFGEMEEGDGSLSRIIEAAERMVGNHVQA